MQAIVITRPGTPDVLSRQQRPTPNPGPGEVRIAVAAAGVNRPDVLQRQGKYPAPPGAVADIPGLEVAGTIDAVGKGVSEWQIGDAVCALVSGGGYATHVVAHAGHCLPVPTGWTLADAASLPETVFTVWHNVFQRGALRAGESLLVHGGSSGIGITAIQLAVAQGATVYATAGTDQKCRACEDLGAVRCINYRATDFAEALAETRVDVVLDMIGGDYFAKNLRLLRPDGRLVHINAMEGRRVELDILALMVKRLTVTGSTLRSRSADFKTHLAQAVYKHVWPFLVDGRFRPVIHARFPLAEAAAAHRLLESSTHIGKVVLVNETELEVGSVYKGRVD